MSDSTATANGSSPMPAQGRRAPLPPLTRTTALAAGIIALGVLGSVAMWFLSRPVSVLASPELALTLGGIFAALAVFGMGLVLGRRPLRTVAWTLGAVLAAPLFWLFWFVVVVQAMLGDWGGRSRSGDATAEEALPAAAAATRAGDEVKREPLQLLGVQRTTFRLAVLGTITLLILGLGVVLTAGPAVRTMAEREGIQQAREEIAAGEPRYWVVVQQDPERIAPLMFDYEHGLPLRLERVTDLWDLAYRKTRAYNGAVRGWIAEHGLPANSALLDPALSEREEAHLLRKIVEEPAPGPGRYVNPAGDAVFVIGEPGPKGIALGVYEDAQEPRPVLGWYVPEVYAVAWLDETRLAVATRDRRDPRHRFDVIDLAAEPVRIVYGRALVEDELPPSALRDNPSFAAEADE